jgi:hypothetical protein
MEDGGWTWEGGGRERERCSFPQLGSHHHVGGAGGPGEDEPHALLPGSAQKSFGREAVRVGLRGKVVLHLLGASSWGGVRWGGGVWVVGG